MENENNGTGFESLSISPDKILEQLKILSAKKRNCQNNIDELEQTLANILCPFKVGDDITICGYSHAGKKGKVEKIKGRYLEWDEFRWFISGYVYKKNGGLSKMGFAFDSGACARYLKEQDKEKIYE